MKYILKIVCFAALLATVVISCKKDENKIYLEEGTAPVLTASSTTSIVFTEPNKDNVAMTFNWNNPNYRFTTGPSSQDVTYILQVDTAGSNFSNPKMQEISISKQLSTSFTVKELNGVLTKMELLENMPHNMEFRLKATIAGAAPLFSNVIKRTITPYLDVAVPVPPSGALYIVGDATTDGWNNNPTTASQKFTKISNTEYTITMALAPGKLYKFLSNLGQWQPQYGGSSATGGDLGFNMGGGNDPDAIPTPSVAGNYKITVNFKTGKYTVEKV